MKKILATSIAAMAITLIPAVAVHADAYPSTNISASQNQSNNFDANKSNTSSSSSEAYYNQTVDYESLAYVKYDASTTAYTKNMQNMANTASLMDEYSNSGQSQFSMPAFMSNYGN